MNDDLLFNNFDIIKLYDDWVKETLRIKTELYITPTPEELQLFYNIFDDIIHSKTDEFFTFFSLELIKKLKRNGIKEFIFKISFYLDKYFTKQLKLRNKQIYNRWRTDRQTNGYLNHKKFILYIDGYYLPDTDTGHFNFAYLTFKYNLTNHSNKLKNHFLIKYID